MVWMILAQNCSYFFSFLREKEALEIAVESQTQQLDASHLEVERLKSMNGELQKQRKLLEEQKEDAIKERERTRKELERGWDAAVVSLALCNERGIGQEDIGRQHLVEEQLRHSIMWVEK